MGFNHGQHGRHEQFIKAVRSKLFTFLFITVGMYSYAADAPVFSGVLNTTLTTGAGTGALPDFYWGLEEYANLRLKKSLGDYGSVYMAFNLIAAGGVSALALQTGPFGVSTPGSTDGGVNSNYAAAMELERLYVHLTGEKIAFDGGLMRLAFGYGNVFSPTDYFNPKNPLYPDARQRAVLGANVIVYPTDMLSLQFFGVGPKDPFKLNGAGVSGGLALENHWKRMSAQFLYSIEAAEESAHNFGLSLKADLPVGITADVLWTYQQEEDASIEGLAASAGLDYSFSIATHTVYLLAEYLYNGSKSKMTGYANHHYLYGTARLSIDDYTSVTVGAFAGFESLSVVPLVSFSTDLFQGAALTLQAQIPLGDGELGAKAANSYFVFTTKLSIKL
ncbi:hypothetical protein FACS1894130_07120 [Spirochaetia bacterium]|nr:hypothetical protein FACS1894130_07120 [Spirochaetia bacterium]